MDKQRAVKEKSDAYLTEKRQKKMEMISGTKITLRARAEAC